MPRATNSPATRQRRKNRLKLAKGFRGARSKLFRQATEAVDRAQSMAYVHRKVKKRDFYFSCLDRLSIEKVSVKFG